MLPEAPILSSFPGMGLILGAEFLVAVGDVSAFGSADRLAAYAGLVPAAHDSGKRVDNHRKGRRQQDPKKGFLPVRLLQHARRPRVKGPLR